MTITTRTISTGKLQRNPRPGDIGIESGGGRYGRVSVRVFFFTEVSIPSTAGTQ